MDDPVKALAEYLTDGKRVIAHSIALEIGGTRKIEADAFFVLRNAFKISGYADVESAEKSIRARIADD